VFDDWQAAYDAFSRGELDWSPVPDGVDAVQTEGGARALVTPANVTVWLALPAVAPFQDTAVREALARLISAEQLRDVAVPNSLPLRGLVPAGIGGHLADTCGSLCQPDRDTAVNLLRERFPAGVPDVTVSVLDDPNQRAVGDGIMRVLGEAGVPARLELLTLEQWVEAIEQPPGQLRVAGGVGIAPTQDDSLAAFLSTDGVVASLVDPELVAQLARARAEPDRQRRIESYRELERRIMSHVVVLPVAQLQLRHAVGARVGDWSPRLDGSVDLSAVRIDDGTG
jgi:ABC-type transport system substrate-binding protein